MEFFDYFCIVFRKRHVSCSLPRTNLHLEREEMSR